MQQRLNAADASAQQVHDELKDSESRRETEVQVRNQLQRELLEAKDQLDMQNTALAELRAKVEDTKESAIAPEPPAMG